VPASQQRPAIAPAQPSSSPPESLSDLAAEALASERGELAHAGTSTPDPAEGLRDSEEPQRALAEGELEVLLDAWGRYGGVVPVDDEAARDRKLIRMFRQYASGDHEAALATAEKILAEKRSVRDAIECARSCRMRVELSRMQRLGGPGASLRVAAAGPIVRALERDDRTSLLMSLIHRKLPLGEILDFHGERRFEVLETITKLVAQGLLEADPSGRVPR
jgi:hypothetical protein